MVTQAYLDCNVYVFDQLVKFSLIKIFVLAKDSKLIENEFVLILKNNKVKNVTKLTTHLISRTKLIHFKEITKV